MKSEWIDTRNCEPLNDGNYFVQTVYGDVTSIGYTLKGGWNTHIDKDGVLSDESAINDGYIVRWFRVERPPEVPEEWMEEYHEERKENA
jgi:hypothetical protein